MRPENLETKIFLDSGDLQETREALKLLGFLDGQTTNPSLIAKNPETAGKKFTQEEILDFYKKVVQEIAQLIPQGSVSIEVYADSSTTAEEMLEQARNFFAWIPNAHIKLPITTEGLKAAEVAVKEGVRVNMTLCFSQEQAAAVYAATLRLRSGQATPKGQVFVSPFVGRLDDIGQDGMDLVANIIKMYKEVVKLMRPHQFDDNKYKKDRKEESGGHVEVLTASVRNLEHLMKAIELGSDIVTAPLKVLREWKQFDLSPNPSPGLGRVVRDRERSKLHSIFYKEINLNKSWQEYDIQHELTDKGIEKFSEDWNSLLVSK